MRELNNAIKNNNIGKLEKLLKQNRNLFHPSVPYKETPILVAAKYATSETLE